MDTKQRRSDPRCASEVGFTLTEILVVLVILGVALAVVIPNIQRTRAKADTSFALRTLDAVLTNARSEALRRHSPVVVGFDTGTRVFTVFEDWDPGNANVGTNGDGVLNGSELTIATTTMDDHLHFAAPGGGNAVDPSSATYLEYAADGTLTSPTGGLIAYVEDTKGNFFRIRISDVTGSSRLEKWLGGTSWSPRRESWVWKY